LYKRLYLRERVRRDKKEAIAQANNLKVRIHAIKRGGKDSIDDAALTRLRELNEVIASNTATLAKIEAELFPPDPLAEIARAREEAFDAARRERAMEVAQELKNMP